MSEIFIAKSQGRDMLPSVHRYLTVFTAGALMAVALVSCGPAYVTDLPRVPATAQEAALADAIFQKVAAYRRSRGCGELRRHAGLDALARGHSGFLLANSSQLELSGSAASHHGFEQRTLVAQRDYSISHTGENVAVVTRRGEATADFIVNLWANSPGHDKNLRNSWSSTGIGVVTDPAGKVFVTQMFGSQVYSSHATTLDRLRRH